MAYQFLGIELHAQIDVEYAQGIVRYCSDELLDGFTRNGVALGERTETYGSGLAGKAERSG